MTGLRASPGSTDQGAVASSQVVVPDPPPDRIDHDRGQPPGVLLGRLADRLGQPLRHGPPGRGVKVGPQPENRLLGRAALPQLDDRRRVPAEHDRGQPLAGVQVGDQDGVTESGPDRGRRRDPRPGPGRARHRPGRLTDHPAQLLGPRPQPRRRPGPRELGRTDRLPRLPQVLQRRRRNRVGRRPHRWQQKRLRPNPFRPAEDSPEPAALQRRPEPGPREVPSVRRSPGLQVETPEPAPLPVKRDHAGGEFPLGPVRLPLSTGQFGARQPPQQPRVEPVVAPGPAVARDELLGGPVPSVSDERAGRDECGDPGVLGKFQLL